MTRTTVLVTPAAQLTVEALRGDVAAAFTAWFSDLERDGCAAMGYRLTGDVVDKVCSRHLYGKWRALVAWSSPTGAVLLLVGEHDRSSPVDIYQQLLGMAGHEPEAVERRHKPPCCDLETGDPPEPADDLVAALSQRVRRGRRR